MNLAQVRLGAAVAKGKHPLQIILHTSTCICPCLLSFPKKALPCTIPHCTTHEQHSRALLKPDVLSSVMMLDKMVL